MKELINRLTAYEILSKEEAKQVIIDIVEDSYTPAQIASFLTVYMMRNIHLQELEGFREALLSLCIAKDFSEYNAIDLCGTGGDGKDTFNISTLSSFITAGAGVNVTKHGNYGVSSGCGSSNVMEYLSVRFSNETDFLKRCLDEAGICILHAPLFHPAMKNVAPVRRELGVKTFFNLLGPLVNPSSPKFQLVGVFGLEIARIYSYLLQKTEIDFSIVYDLGGYDEISLTNKAKIVSRDKEILLSPRDLGLKMIEANKIAGGENVESSAAIFMKILEGNGTAEQQNVVCTNAGIAIATATGISIQQGFEKAKESLLEGKALSKLKLLQKISAK